MTGAPVFNGTVQRTSKSHTATHSIMCLPLYTRGRLPLWLDDHSFSTPRNKILCENYSHKAIANTKKTLPFHSHSSPERYWRQRTNVEQNASKKRRESTSHCMAAASSDCSFMQHWLKFMILCTQLRNIFLAASQGRHFTIFFFMLFEFGWFFLKVLYISGTLSGLNGKSVKNVVLLSEKMLFFSLNLAYGWNHLRGVSSHKLFFSPAVGKIFSTTIKNFVHHTPKKKDRTKFPPKRIRRRGPKFPPVKLKLCKSFQIIHAAGG